MMKRTIQITIVNDSRVEGCTAECGVDWASAEERALASKRLKDRFGENIELEYLDLAKSPADRRAQELKRHVREKNLLLPLLTINGRMRISGDFDIRQLLDAVEAETELEIS